MRGVPVPMYRTEDYTDLLLIPPNSVPDRYYPILQMQKLRRKITQPLGVAGPLSSGLSHFRIPHKQRC